MKALGLPEVTERALFCEAFGNLLARELGIETFPPALIELSPEFVGDTNPFLQTLPQLAGRRIELQAGTAVGTEYHSRGNLTPVSSLTVLSDDEHRSHAVSIYAYDLLVQNPDRAGGPKPNCAIEGNRIIAFDFELAFSFLLALTFGSQPQPWEVSRHGISGKHVFYNQLRGQRHPPSLPILQLLTQLTDNRLRQLALMLPAGWQTWADRVCAHIVAVRDHVGDFEVELRRSLA